VADAVVLRDQKLTQGRWVERVTTVHDRLGGRPELVAQKLEILERIRDEMDRALPRLKGEEAAFAKQWRPPDDLRAPTVDDLPPLIKARFTEQDGRVGTAVYVYLNPKLSRSRGENLLEIADLFEGVSVKPGQIVPNASRATVFAEMIRSMGRDAPLATSAALAVVLLVSLLATRALGPASAVLGSLLVGVWLTVGCAAWLNVRLNYLNFVALPLTFGIGVEYAINLYDRVRLYGGDIARGIASAGGAVGLCSLTTILGYGALIFADNQALQSFGKYAVFGEVSCMVTALVIMPATLEIFRRRKGNSAPSST
jgi:predicted RND superfamily exporter protein